MVEAMQAPASEREVSAIRFTPRCVRSPSTLRFVGALDAFTVDDAMWRIEAVLEESPRQVIVDLDQLELLDSAGVHALVTLYKRVTAQGGRVAVVNVHDQPLAVLQLLNLNAVFGL